MRPDVCPRPQQRFELVNVTALKARKEESHCAVRLRVGHSSPENAGPGVVACPWVHLADVRGKWPFLSVRVVAAAEIVLGGLELAIVVRHGATVPLASNNQS